MQTRGTTVTPVSSKNCRYIVKALKEIDTPIPDTIEIVRRPTLELKKIFITEFSRNISSAKHAYIYCNKCRIGNALLPLSFSLLFSVSIIIRVEIFVWSSSGPRMACPTSNQVRIRCLNRALMLYIKPRIKWL